MSFINQILENDTYTSSVLKTMIEQEVNRVISNKLLSKAECIALFNKYSNLEQSDLLQIYNKLACVKLAGDTLENSPEDFKEKILNKLKEPIIEVKSEKCICANTCGKCSDDDTVNKLNDVYSTIFDKLEKIAYDLGNRGDQETAYLVERTLSKIKSDL